MIETQVEIAAPPSLVREVFLDFSKYPEWHTGFLNLLEAEDSSKSLSSLKPGDKIRADIDGYKITAEIKQNTPDLFQWQGPPVLGGLIAGLHGFHMEPTKDGSSTLFKQTEKFSGLLAFIMSPSLLGGKFRDKFDGFNKDLKQRAEALYQGQS